MTAVTENQRTPLEQFVRDYLEVTGGVWDEIEPQVYDVLVAPDRPDIRPEEIDVCRIVFDTEALPEHPQAQLASFGTPLIDTFLQQAIQRARQLHLWRLVSHAIPHNLDARLGRAFTFPEGSTWECTRVRPLDFPQAVYWFQVTFSSDQREDDLIVAAVDLHYLRLMRHWERLLDPASLARQPSILLPEVRRATVAQGFDVAQQSALRTVSGLANLRQRELQERVRKQTERMRCYYDDLKRELLAGQRRTTNPEETAKRVAAIEREAQIRIAELIDKYRLAVQLRLLWTAIIHQAKLLVDLLIRPDKGDPVALKAVFDPLTDSVEPAVCPNCAHPTFQWRWQLMRPGCRRLVCATCPAGLKPK